MLSGYNIFLYYMSLKLHFTKEGYNAIQYKFKVNQKSCSESTFRARKDRGYFNRLSYTLKDKKHAIGYFVAHFIHGHVWVGDMIQSGPDVYQKWKSKMESLSYIIRTDLSQLSNQNFDDVLTQINIESNGLYPPIITQYLSGQLSIETIAFIEKMTGFIRQADKEITDTMLWSDHSLKIRKYAPFIPIDKERGRKLILQVFRS